MSEPTFSINELVYIEGPGSRQSGAIASLEQGFAVILLDNPVWRQDSGGGFQQLTARVPVFSLRKWPAPKYPTPDVLHRADTKTVSIPTANGLRILLNAGESITVAWPDGETQVVVPRGVPVEAPKGRPVRQCFPETGYFECPDCLGLSYQKLGCSICGSRGTLPASPGLHVTESPPGRFVLVDTRAEGRVTPEPGEPVIGPPTECGETYCRGPRGCLHRPYVGDGYLCECAPPGRMAKGRPGCPKCSGSGVVCPSLPCPEPSPEPPPAETWTPKVGDRVSKDADWLGAAFKGRITMIVNGYASIDVDETTDPTLKEAVCRLSGLTRLAP